MKNEMTPLTLTGIRLHIKCQNVICRASFHVAAGSCFSWFCSDNFHYLHLDPGDLRCMHIIGMADEAIRHCSNFEGCASNVLHGRKTSWLLMDVFALQILPLLRSHAAVSESPEPVRSWQAEYAFHKLILHQAQLTSGNTLPGVDLLLPGAAAQHLAPGSNRVKMAQRRATKLEAEHLESRPMNVSDAEFKPFVVDLALHEVRSLQQQLAIKVASRMDADSQLNDLASDRPNDVKRLRKQLQTASTAIAKLMSKLGSWLQHPDLTRNLLSPGLQRAQDTVSDWALAQFQHGNFPWEQEQTLSETLSQAQLISRLHRQLNLKKRAAEEPCSNERRTQHWPITDISSQHSKLQSASMSILLCHRVQMAHQASMQAAFIHQTGTTVSAIYCKRSCSPSNGYMQQQRDPLG